MGQLQCQHDALNIAVMMNVPSGGHHVEIAWPHELADILVSFILVQL